MDLVSDAAIVTGAAQGIGRGIAEELARLGASIAIADVDVEGAESTAAEIEAAYDVDTVAIECDVADSAAVGRMVEASVDEFGEVGILVNNAGIGPLSLVWEMDEAEWDDVVDICLKGTFLCSKATINHMIETGIEGSIVNVSSINYKIPTDGIAHYAAAKAGIAQFTKAVAGEAGRHGIRMNAVAPGSTHTPLAEENGMLEGRFGREWRERTPLEHRFGQPEDIGKVAAFLASDYAGWVTGETICVDGGQNIRGLHSYWDVYQEQFVEGESAAEGESVAERDQETPAD